MDNVFKALYFAGLIAEIVLRMPYDRQRRQIVKTDQRITAAEKAIFGGLSLGMFALPLVYSLTHWLDKANYRWSPAAKARGGGLGALVLAASIWLFWRSHHDLGANWSPSLEIGEKHTLVTRGVYRSIRHPMYASQLLWAVAQSLLLQNWIAGIAGIFTFLPLYFVRVPKEEEMMIEHFGDDYREYAAHTGRILPRFQR